MKMLKFGTKNTLFGYFWARLLKKLFSYLKTVPLKLLITSFNSVKLGIGSTFSEDPGSGTGTLYKVCPLQQAFSNEFFRLAASEGPFAQLLNAESSLFGLSRSLS